MLSFLSKATKQQVYVPEISFLIFDIFSISAFIFFMKALFDSPCIRRIFISIICHYIIKSKSLAWPVSYNRF